MGLSNVILSLSKDGPAHMVPALATILA